MEEDRNHALKIAKWCKELLPSEEIVRREHIIESFSAEPVQSARKKIDQEKTNGANQEKNEDVERKKEDYSIIIDTLRDPPVGDYGLVRGWSETDDLYQKPQVDETSQQLAEMFEANIVDFYQRKEGDMHVGMRVWIFSAGPRAFGTLFTRGRQRQNGQRRKPRLMVRREKRQMQFYLTIFRRNHYLWAREDYARRQEQGPNDWLKLQVWKAESLHGG